MADLKSVVFPSKWLVFTAVALITYDVSQIFGQVEADLGENEADDQSRREPLVSVAMLVRNKAHTLPWFLNYFEKLDYPKDRLRLWIRSDHNEDNSAEIVHDWLVHVRHEYNLVDFVDDPSENSYDEDERPFAWPQERMDRIMHLRQLALDTARQLSSDYLLMIDVDNFLLNSSVLKDLIKEDRIIIAPMFNVSTSEHYSNFWGGMDSKGYYVRTSEYLPILKRETIGVFEVAVVHSTFLIDLKNPASKKLSFLPPPDYSGPVDDIIVFARTAQRYGVPVHVLNRDFYGFMLVPMEDQNSIDDEEEQFVHLKLEYIVLGKPLEKLPYIQVPERPLSKFGFDEIYLINLVRRPDRREKMLASFRELGINATIVDAVDGKSLTDSYLVSLGVSMMPGYADPYHGRAMTTGEIGCFLSHYFIWQNILQNHHSKVIVFEDDVRFRPYFPQKLNYLMEEATTLMPNWELIYLGRKRLLIEEEAYVEGSDFLVWPHYSYWTLSYILSYEGAKKLMNQRPLTKMLPVDEYLPIMFDKHPETEWKENFSPRDLVSLSVHPLLVEPTHYTGEKGYITDTEDSRVVGEAVSGVKGDQEIQNNHVEL